MSKIIFGNTLDLLTAGTPSAGGYIVAYDLDGILKQKDEFGVITEIGGGPTGGIGGTPSLYNVLLAGNDTVSENIIMGTSTSILSSNGGGQIDLDFGGSSNQVTISNDNGTLSKGWIYLIDTKGEFGFDNSFLRTNTNSSSLYVDNIEQFIIANNSTASISSSGTNKYGAILASNNSSIDAGIINSVIIGGGSLAGTQSNTVYLGNYVNINNAYTLPINDGSSGQVLTTDGSGNIYWAVDSSSFNLEQVLSVGNESGTYDIIMGTQTVIKSNNGGGQIELDATGLSNSVYISTDNGALSTSNIQLDESNIIISSDNVDVFSGSDTLISANGTLAISGQTGSVLIGDGRGLVYGFDYSSTFVNNSLVSKLYVDNGTASLWGELNNYLPLSGGTITGNLVVDGDLTVSGTQTVINTENLYVEDNIITLNATYSGPAVIDAGVEVNLGDGTYSKVLWDAGTGYWQVGLSGSESTIITEPGSGLLKSNNTLSVDFGTVSSISYVDSGTASIWAAIESSNELSEVLANGNETLGNNIIMSTNDVIQGGTGIGGELNLRYNGYNIDDVMLSTNNSAWDYFGANLLLSTSETELSNYVGGIGMVTATGDSGYFYITTPNYSLKTRTRLINPPFTNLVSSGEIVVVDSNVATGLQSTLINDLSFGETLDTVFINSKGVLPQNITNLVAIGTDFVTFTQSNMIYLGQDVQMRGNLIKYINQPSIHPEFDDLTVITKKYVDDIISSNNELSEVLSNGNETLGNNVIMTSQDVLEFEATGITYSITGLTNNSPLTGFQYSITGDLTSEIFVGNVIKIENTPNNVNDGKHVITGATFTGGNTYFQWSGIVTEFNTPYGDATTNIQLAEFYDNGDEFVLNVPFASGGLIYKDDYSSTFVTHSLVDKLYVDNGTASLWSELNNYLPLSGGTMTGNITLDSGTHLISGNANGHAFTLSDGGDYSVWSSVKPSGASVNYTQAWMYMSGNSDSATKEILIATKDTPDVTRGLGISIIDDTTAAGAFNNANYIQSGWNSLLITNGNRTGYLQNIPANYDVNVAINSRVQFNATIKGAVSLSSYNLVTLLEANKDFFVFVPNLEVQGGGLYWDTAPGQPNWSGGESTTFINSAAANVHVTKEWTNSNYLPLSGGTLTGNLIVNGDLTVSGTQTVINTENLYVEDNIITLNATFSGTPILDSGIEVNRGTGTWSKLFWDETQDYWVAGLSGSESVIITENGTGLNKSGNELSVDTSTIATVTYVDSKKHTEFGLSLTASVASTITHNLGTQSIICQAWDTSTGETLNVVFKNRATNSVDILSTVNVTVDVIIQG